MPRTLRSGLVTLALPLALGCHHAARPGAIAPRSAEPVHLVLAATTDLHGWFEGHELALPGGGSVHLGGQPMLAGYVANLRAAFPGRVVLLDGGDLFQGTLASNLAEGEPVIVGANALGYAASAVGNHEFDYGPVGEHSVVIEPGEDPLGALKKNAAAANFPFLAANVTEKASGQRPAWLRPSLLLNVAGVRLGIIGLSTPRTPEVTATANVAGLVFSDPVAATIAEAHALRGQGADAVVVVAHMGAICGDLTDLHDLASCDAENESFAFAQALPAGTIDAYFGGHTHQPVTKIVNGVPIVQASPFGKGLGMIDLWVDPQAHHALADRSQIRPLAWTCEQVFRGTENCDPKTAPPGAELVPARFAGQPVTLDLVLAARLNPYLDRVARLRRQKLGITLGAAFTRHYTEESALGNLITDATREAIPGADFAIGNPGGLRANLPAGEATYGDLYAVIPFDNLGATIQLSGTQLRELLRIATGGESVCRTSGLRIVVDLARDHEKPARDRDRLVSVTRTDGSALLPDRLYTVATSDFLANGGEGIGPLLAQLPAGSVQILYQSPPLRDLVIQALQRRAQDGPLMPVLDGRIELRNASVRREE